MPFFIKSVGDEASKLQVRATLAYTFALAIIAGFFLGKVPFDAFGPIAYMSISWYFATRNTEERAGLTPK